MKEHTKLQNSTNGGTDSQPIRCTVQNTGNQVMNRNSCVWSQNRGRSKWYKTWNKESVQGTYSEKKETRTQTKDLEQKEEINIQSEQNKETRIQKNKEILKKLQDIFKSSNIWIIGEPEREEEEQEAENLPEKIMKTSPIWI